MEEDSTWNLPALWEETKSSVSIGVVENEGDMYPTQARHFLGDLYLIKQDEDIFLWDETLLNELFKETT